jgi:hypothetical protein
MDDLKFILPLLEYQYDSFNPYKEVDTTNLLSHLINFLHAQENIILTKEWLDKSFLNQYHKMEVNLLLTHKVKHLNSKNQQLKSGLPS